jgi:hypothetical protein
MERGLHRESISGLTAAQVMAWRPGDDVEQVAVVVLSEGSVWAQREEKEDEERCGGGRQGLPLYGGRGRDGGR